MSKEISASQSEILAFGEDIHGSSWKPNHRALADGSARHLALPRSQALPVYRCRAPRQPPIARSTRPPVHRDAARHHEQSSLAVRRAERIRRDKKISGKSQIRACRRFVAASTS
jgi:hypothetical protein